MLAKDVNNTHRDNPKESLSIILKAMEMKSELLRKTDINSLEDFKKVTESIFYIKRHYEELIKQNSLSALSNAYSILKDESLAYDERVKKFNEMVKLGEEQEDVKDMAREIIHFLYPDKYPLWTRWIWNEERNTGSLTYILNDNAKIKSEEDYFNAVKELKNTLDIFGLNLDNYYATSIFLVYAYVRYVDYATLLAVDKKGGGLYPTHLATTSLILGLKPFLKVIQLAHS
ncbi:MAG: hypothetical protein OWQ54_00025 [Sulfolobaceae archaeon]|nr:hypothetical protein [Sulfolobaceae archaeon]